MQDRVEQRGYSADDPLDQVLRQELRWEAPPELTARLLGLIPGVTPVTEAVPAPRPKPWYTSLVLVLTAIIMGISLALARQVVEVLSAELGFVALIEQVRVAPAIMLQYMYEAFPASRQMVALLAMAHEQLHWLLLAIVLWLVLEGDRTHGIPLRRAH